MSIDENAKDSSLELGVTKPESSASVSTTAGGQAITVAPRCLSIDLEVGKQDHKIHRFAAVRGDTNAAYVYRTGNLATALDELDTFAGTVSFLLGHNLIAFDLPHLAAAKPDMRLFRLPAVDTLCLNPLAFPRNPYHHLVKHYQDGRLQSGQANDPELDARLTLNVFREQLVALQEMHETAPDLLSAWHWLATEDSGMSGLNAFFSTVRRRPRPTDAEALDAITRRLTGQACVVQASDILKHARSHGWALAYALAWLSVSGGNSVMPPWVRHQFPEAGTMIRRLRDTRCGDPSCDWCLERHDARKELTRWFGFPDFRPQPADAAGRPLQEVIVEAAMAGKHVLGILPTGTGKSLCYQIPALSRYDKTGALTVVISPLVALMADQVAGLEARGIASCAAVNGLLSLPERADTLDRIRLGDVGIVILSPEQLRNRSVRKVLEQREIGMWVLDEAHCVSKWGHDFRPDYRYVGRFIKEKAQEGPIPPVLCLTATAKPEVVADMLGHFRDKVGIELTVFDGGASRDNLEFSVVPTTPAEKFAHVHQLLQTDLPAGAQGGAIVYCSSRKTTEEIAQFLQEKGLSAGHFHAGLQPEEKKSIQQRFIAGELQVIAATNAFGMGIDKPDVRLVIHADIPGSLENYLQEAGRAGRDRAHARCVLLYTEQDVERQFSMSARSRLSQREIQSILKSLRALERKKTSAGEVIATAGEILAEETDGVFERDSATDDTRVRTAISWLEEASLLSREENHVQVFPSSLRIGSIEEARKKLPEKILAEEYRRQLLAIIQALISADPDEGISTDELMGVSGLSADKVRSALYELERLGIASNDTALTAFVHAGVSRSSQKRLEQAIGLELALVGALREAAPDLHKGDATLLQLRHTTQHLKDAGHAYALPEKISRLVNGIAMDGRSEDSGVGSLRARRLDAENIQITLQREWSVLEKTVRLRHSAAKRALDHLLATLPQATHGTDLLAETTLGKLHAAISADLVLKAAVKDTTKLLDRALLWLHEQEVIRLNKGLAVFRPAMMIRLGTERRNFAKADFSPLQLHYHEQIIQIHVMAEYVQRGLQAMADALRLAMDYFQLNRDEFLRRWLPKRETELARQTTPASWTAIVDDLNNPVQKKIVADDREQTNVLVLAGPGSGKTRVLVHRIAYLIRVKRENPHGILALAYNRHAAVQIRGRLAALIGDDAKGVVVLTCHAFAMRLTGTSFHKQAIKDDHAFDAVMCDAISLLKGEGMAPDEADAQRDRLLAGFRWILVDEYQDIGSNQYELISALAGRTRPDEDGKLSLFAVGDDDQNIYAFDGASVEFIRRFEADYAAKPTYLLENYRSTGHIINAANHVIAASRHRMKDQHPVIIDRARAKLDDGGDWRTIDPVGEGRVQILPGGGNRLTQAMVVMLELHRLAALSPDWNWSQAAVISREWESLEPVRSYCELHGIPVQMADEEAQFWRLRETQQLIAWLRKRETKLIDTATIEEWMRAQASGPWWTLLKEAISDYAGEITSAELPLEHFVEWLAEWGREVRRRQSGLLLLSAHRAKGLEFDHVSVLDGGWNRQGKNEDADAPRRLFYVAMTRARKTLTLIRMNERHALLDGLSTMPCVQQRAAIDVGAIPVELNRNYKCLTPADVDLGYAGRHSDTHPVHHAIAALTAGDPIHVRQTKGRWELTDRNDRTIGRLSSKYVPPAGMRCISASVHSIITRRSKDTESEYQSRDRCDQWEVVLPELVFEPVELKKTVSLSQDRFIA